MAAIATSQNGWPVYTNGTHSDLVSLSYVTGRVRSGVAAVILGYVAEQFNERVERVRKDWSWGYAYRAIRGQTSGFSNHASATAIDLNAPNHPLGARGTFSAAQVRAIRAILATCGGTVRWGGDYLNRPDEMHFEISVRPGDPRLATALAKIGGTKLPAITPTTPTTQEDDDMTPEQSAKLDAVFAAVAERPGIERAGESAARQTVNYPIWRGGKPVALIQEVANILTNTGTILAVLKAMADGDEVDLPAIEAALEDAAQSGAEKALTGILAQLEATVVDAVKAELGNSEDVAAQQIAVAVVNEMKERL